MLGRFFRKRVVEPLGEPLPASWRDLIGHEIPLCARLPVASKSALEPLVKRFLAEKSFEGCGGLELTETIKLTIAAQASVLLLARETKVFPLLRTILVYPNAYLTKVATPIKGGGWLEGEDIFLGEAPIPEVVILSWNHIRSGNSYTRSGRNLVLHEFAHQLDREDGSMNGAPLLESPRRYREWARVMTPEFERLERRAELGRHTVIDDYGATNPAEFFAVVTETFFERPHTLRRHHPALYRQLATFYRQDPATWSATPEPDHVA